MTTAMKWVSLGQLPYDDALHLQQTRADALLAEVDNDQTVFCVEHPPTITIGRNGTFANIVASRDDIETVGFDVREVDRGGDVTYHGPGQLVIYPVLHLAPWSNDVPQYVRRLEECAIQSLMNVGIEAQRLDGYPGVWVGSEKICAIGVRMRKRHTGEFVTTHGLALNVSTELSHFQAIVPCGITDKGVTSVAALTGHAQDMGVWETRVKAAFCNVFDAFV